MIYRVASSLLLLLSLLPALGCDKATPVAPNGTVLTISANPSQIGLNGRSTITIVGRKPDGNPLNPGTEIRLSTNRGTIDSIVTTDDGGRATATFRGDGRQGEAMITAMTSNAMVMTTIQVGQSDATRPTVLVSVAPSTVPVEGTATVTVIARNADGTPVGAGQTVILTTTLGTITPARPQTRADGTATATLQAGDQAGTATITAIVGSSAAATAMVTIRDAATDMSLQPNPTTIPNTGGTITLTAFVSNSQGQPLQGAPVNFQSGRGTLDQTQDFTDTTGLASVTLTLTPNDVSGNGLCNFTVTASTPSGTGALITRTATIRITGNQGCTNP
jgi:adhesin/invasin